MVHGDLKGVSLLPIVTPLYYDLLCLQEHILVDSNGRARIAGFSLLTMIPDQMGFVPAGLEPEGGTTQWMSPELLDPARFGLRDSCSTTESDCYALGMVVYEVLSERSPFPSFGAGIVILKVLDGERPARPQGVEGVRFTDAIWEMLERCWKPQPQDRPSVKAVLECLEGVPTSPGDTESHTDHHPRELSVL